MDITIQPLASRKHVNITLEIVFSASLTVILQCVRVTRDVEKGKSVCTCNMGMTG